MEVLMSDPLPKAVAPDMLRTNPLASRWIYRSQASPWLVPTNCVACGFGEAQALPLWHQQFHVVVKDPTDIYKLCEKQWTAYGRWQIKQGMTWHWSLFRWLYYSYLFISIYDIFRYLLCISLPQSRKIRFLVDALHMAEISTRSVESFSPVSWSVSAGEVGSLMVLVSYVFRTSCNFW